MKVISIFLVIVAFATTSAQNTKCPFQYLYMFGDGATDFGNSIRIPPTGPSLPAARPPYGTTFPGTPTGRWSNGLLDGDYAAIGVGLPNRTAYLSMSPTSGTVSFSVANSPALNSSFFTQRNITIPSYATPLSRQIEWFSTYLTSVSSNATERANRIANSTMLISNTEANDMGYALIQGKSIAEVKSYVPFIIQAQINATRELIKMGATRVVFSENSPIGCFPYILTALPSPNPLAYDVLGCLKSVNGLMTFKNSKLQLAVTSLKTEFPNVTLLVSSDYEAAITVITSYKTTSASGLKACCGIGGRYNYNSTRFCGSPGVPVCPNPNRYIFWDGVYFTQEAYRRILKILVAVALPALKCNLL